MLSRTRVTLAGILLSLTVGSVAASASTPSTTTTTAPQTLLTRIAAAVTANQLPSNLNPSLADIHAKGPFQFEGDGLITRVCDYYDHPELASNPAPCYFGSKTSTKTVVLWGDSNAGNWIPALDSAFATLGYRLAYFGFPGCATAFVKVGESGAFADPGQSAACNTFHSALPAAVRALKPVALFAVSGAAFYTNTTALTNQWVAGMAAAFNQLSAGLTGVRRFEIGTSPMMASDMPTCLALHQSSMTTCWLNAKSRGYPLQLTRNVTEAKASNATLLPVSTWFCLGNVCPGVEGSTLIYGDLDHTTKVFSLETVPLWLPLLRANKF
jgi:hypothetical protein